MLPMEEVVEVEVGASEVVLHRTLDTIVVTFLSALIPICQHFQRREACRMDR